MHPFEIMAAPVRRRIVDILASGEHTSGQIAAVVRNEFGISPTAVSKHLMKMLNAGFVDVREEWANRYYRLDDRAIGCLETEVRTLRWKLQGRMGWNTPDDPMTAGIEAPRGPRTHPGRDHSSDSWS